MLLAGGSQMAAVLALIVALERSRAAEPLDLDRIGIATTSWVARDPTADLAGLVSRRSPTSPSSPATSTSPQSRHVPLRRYEDFLVKEGVGAGAAAVVAALVADADHALLLAAIERVYEEIYGLDVTAS